ncbi:MAG: quinone-dependent dihydroorotate dehydrogenase [Bifidobacteriaceae bacterium]|jgi:dihydroorotate dehydrogenase|nr:quinone-dependent dihydroorotate dehydrogenase [Bifidobacteriaceae bacterium]
MLCQVIWKIVYGLLFQVVFRRMDPERAHRGAYALIRLAGEFPPARAVVKRLFGPQRGTRRAQANQAEGPKLFGRTLRGPLGLAAGFDKEAKAVKGLTALGFSFVEVGTVTRFPQPGNPRPRLWRDVKAKSLRNAMGFNNAGAAAVAGRLRQLRAANGGASYVVGVNIGKSKVTPPADAPDDYFSSARHLARYADYLVVNVSSPNTPGLRDLQQVSALKPILEAARKGARKSLKEAGRQGEVPLLVKIAPDLADADVDAVAGLVNELDLAGVVAVNTTVAHDQGKGGLSGPPLKSRGLEVVARLREQLDSGRVIIGVGGISTPQDVREYLAAGADVVQAYTAFIYEGPAWAGRTQRALRAEAQV